MKDPYAVLGARKGDDRQELSKKYNELRKKYVAERRLSGEAGNDGKRKLHELDEAWYEITLEIGEVAPEEIGSDADDTQLESDIKKDFKSFGKDIASFGKSIGKAANNFFTSLFGKDDKKDQE